MFMKTKKTISFLMIVTMVLGCLVPTLVFAGQIDPSITANLTLANGNQFWGDYGITLDSNDGDNDPETTYVLHIQADFGSVIATDGVKVNGIVYQVPGGNEEETLFLKTPANNHFEIEVTYEEGFAGNMMPNIVWTYSQATCEAKGYAGPDGKCDALIEHGKIEIVKITNDNGTLTAAQLKERDDQGNAKYRDGFIDEAEDSVWAEIEEGSEVTIKMIPDYGYQLTKLQVNDTVFKAATEQSTYTFKMAAGALHLSALFTKVDDVVKTTTDKVKEGIIKIDNQEISTGSTILSVKDASLTDEQKAKIEKEAGEYKVSNIFDIKLDQVIYKGTEKDVWSNPLGATEDLKKPATITLNLDKDVDGKETVLVHEKEDGTYEIIETTYDEEKHTISFSTSSFSNYALASKNNVELDTVAEVKNPQTFDGITAWVVLSGISIVGIAGSVIYIKKSKKTN